MPMTAVRDVSLFPARELIHGAWRTRLRPEALVFAGRHLLNGWTVMDRLGKIKVPALVMAGRDDFLFPPEHHAEPVTGIPNARLQIVEHARHNPHSEQTAQVLEAVSAFILSASATPKPSARKG